GPGGQGPGGGYPGMGPGGQGPGGGYPGMGPGGQGPGGGYPGMGPGGQGPGGGYSGMGPGGKYYGDPMYPNFAPTSNQMTNHHFNRQLLEMYGSALSIRQDVQEGYSRWTQSEGLQNFGAVMYGHRPEGESQTGVNNFVSSTGNLVGNFHTIVNTADQLGNNLGALPGSRNALGTINMAFAIAMPGVDHVNHQGMRAVGDVTDYASNALAFTQDWKDFKAGQGMSPQVGQATNAPGVMTTTMDTILRRTGGWLGVAGSVLSVGESIQHATQGNYLDSFGSGLDAVGSAAFAAAMFFPPVAVTAGVVGLVATAGGLIIRYREPIGKALSWVGDKASKAWNSTVDGVKSVGNAISDGAKSVGNAISDGAKSVGKGISNGFNKLFGN
ncbi:hypothetical protein, partial [Geomicrobium sediminis]